MNTILLLLAILPVVILAIYVYLKDKQQKEPLPMLIKAFLFGVLSIVPAVGMEMALSLFDPALPVVSGLYNGYVVAAFSEELCKLLLLYWAVWKSPHFDEYFDGIVYATFVSLGFACVENIQYVFLQDTWAASLHTGLLRALLSVPGHFLFGVSMGYFFALAKFRPHHRLGNLLIALLLPLLLHGTYDALLMIPESMPDSAAALSTLLLVGFVWFDIKLWKIGRRRLTRLQELSARQAATDSLAHIDWSAGN